MIGSEGKIERFKPNLGIEEVENTIVKNDLTNITDIMTELIKKRDK